jgi:acetyltransferase-like isoleucine patch superfamily enzyme
MPTLGNLKAFLLTVGSPAWRVYLRLRGLEVGKGFTCMGRPGINRKRGSSIKLGRNVTLCSTGIANPVSEGGRCRLSTLAIGAEILLADGVGLSSTLICAATRVEIGEGTMIGGGAMILDTDFHHRNTDGTWGTDPARVSKPIHIGKRCFIGARATILKGVTIGDGAVVGAGAVVTRDVPAGALVAGNPAAIIS